MRWKKGVMESMRGRQVDRVCACGAGQDWQGVYGGTKGGAEQGRG